jgi:hypothetical protein
MTRRHSADEAGEGRSIVRATAKEFGMKLRMLKVRPNDEIAEQATGRGRGPLRIVAGSTRIIEWPYPIDGQSRPEAVPPLSEPTTAGGIVVTSDIQTKRFRERTVDAEQFTATVHATDRSPSAMLSALLDAFAGIGDFRQAGGPNDQIVLQISLRG